MGTVDFESKHEFLYLLETAVMFPAAPTFQTDFINRPIERP